MLFVIFGQFGFTQVYQLMPQYGYEVKRMSFDSTLQIPTTCGVPTLKSVYNVKRGAIAFDSCNNRFYTYNPKTATWSYLGSGGGSSTGVNGLNGTTNIGLGGTLTEPQTNIESASGQELLTWGLTSPFSEFLINATNLSLLGFDATSDTGTFKPLVIDPITHHVSNLNYYPTGSGGTTDTTSLSNRINQRIDSLKRSGDSVFARKNGVFVFQYKDSVGGGATPSLQQVTNVGNTTTNEIKTTDASFGVFKTDINVIDGTEYYPLLFQNEINTPNIDSFYIKTYRNGEFNPIIKGKAATSPYKEFSISPDTIFLRNSDYNTTYILPQTISATAHTNYFPSPITGGSTYDNPFGQATDTLATLQSIRHLKNYVDSSAIDTTGAFLISVSQPNDSTLTFQKGATQTSYIIRSSVAGSATRLVTSVYNNTGSTITKGSVVYINGRHSSNLPTIALAQANNEENSYSTFALVENDIPTSSSGIAIQAGNIGNLNLPTATYTDGQIVYLSPTTAGGITTTKPLAPNHIVKIGTITRAHPTFGSIELKIENGWQLDELSDVSIAVVPADSTLLQFSRVDSLWHDVSVVNAIGTKYIKPSDTSVFQRKSVASYSFHANNTSGTANVTDQVFKDLGNQTYSGTITWTGTTAPSGTTNHKYRWSQIGKQVTITISLIYGTAGSALTAVKLTLPADCPSPTNFGTLTGANDVIGSSWAFLGTSTSAATTGRVLLQNNAANNGFEFNIAAASGAYRTSGFTLTYFTD